MSGENPASTTEYIQHHLQNLVYGKLPGGFERQTENGTEVLAADTWTMAHGATEAAAMGFWAIHVDSMAWSSASDNMFCCSASNGCADTTSTSTAFSRFAFIISN